MSIETQEQIVIVCDSIRDLLLEKNRKYGDSALNPRRTFSKADTVEQIKVRIDDKLNRIENTGFTSVDEDTLQDLIGYLVLLKIALNNQEGKDEVPDNLYEEILKSQDVDSQQLEPETPSIWCREPVNWDWDENWMLPQDRG